MYTSQRKITAYTGIVFAVLGLIAVILGALQPQFLTGWDRMSMLLGAVAIGLGLLVFGLSQIKSPHEKALDRIEQLETQVKELQNRP